jgi:hypothetical protein
MERLDSRRTLCVGGFDDDPKSVANLARPRARKIATYSPVPNENLVSSVQMNAAVQGSSVSLSFTGSY